MNGSLTLQLGSTNAVVVNKTTGIANSKVTGLTSVSISGRLVVNSVGNALAPGDAIQLFTAGSYAGNFTSFTPNTPGTGTFWNTSTLSTDGTIRVSSSTPTNITSVLNGNQLTLSWGADHVGWTLQAQTNNLGTNWSDVPGSTSASQITFTINPANRDVFYRMILRQ